MQYKGIMFRPPVEADTFLLPVTEGCSHNACKFCNMYENISFRMCDLGEVEEYFQQGVKERHDAGKQMDRVYLVGADPFVLSADRMQVIVDMIHRHAPECKTITMYAAIRNIKIKSDEDLLRMKEMGINDLYVGMETALADVLDFMNKGNTAEELKAELLRLNRMGIRHREMIMIGVAGKGRCVENARVNAEFFNEVKPDMILINTIAAFPGTELAKQVEAGAFTMAEEKEVLLEEKTLLENLKLDGTYFWAAHPMNYIMIEGKLPEAKERLMKEIDEAIEHFDEDDFPIELLRTSL